jgi:hypothetical protein
MIALIPNVREFIHFVEEKCLLRSSIHFFRGGVPALNQATNSARDHRTVLPIRVGNGPSLPVLCRL